MFKMNYKVTISLLFFVHVQSAFIGGRSRLQDNEKLHDEDSIQEKRILLGAGSAKHNVVVGSSNKLEMNESLCEQCRRSKICKIDGDCKKCYLYCKPNESGLVKDISSSEEVGIARDPENDILLEGLKDRTLVSKVRQDSSNRAHLIDEVMNERNEPIDSPEGDDQVVQMSRSHTEDQTDTEQFDRGIHRKTNEESIESRINRLEDAKEVEKFNEKERESRYYVLGMINSGLLLNILSRLAKTNDHFDIRRNHFDRAIILVKSSIPIQIKHNIMEKIGDSTFLRILENDLNRAEQNLHEKGPLSGGQIDNIIQIAHEKAEAKFKKLESPVVGMEEKLHEEQNNDTVGCIKEEDQVLPFYPIQSNLYRSGSISQKEDNHHNARIESGDADNLEDNIERNQAKNPQVIQDNPNIELRSNTPKSKLDLDHSIRNQIFDSISDQLRTLENMNVVGSKKDTLPITKGRYEERKGSTEKDTNNEQFLRERLTDNIGSDEESVEENDQARTFHKKKKMMKKKGGSYAPSYGHGNSYGNQGHGGYGHYYRHASPEDSNIDSYESHKDIDKQVEKDTKFVDPNSSRTLINEPEQVNHAKTEPYEVNSQKHHDRYDDSLRDQNNYFNKKSKANTKFHKKGPNAKQMIDSQDKLAKELGDNRHAKFGKTQTKNEDEGRPKTSIEIDHSFTGESEDRTDKFSNRLAPTSFKESDNDEVVVSTKHKKYKQPEKYNRMSDYSSSLEDEELSRINNAPNRRMMGENLNSEDTLNEDGIKEPFGNQEVLGIIHNSGENIAPNRLSDQSSIKQKDDTGFIHHNTNDQSKISDMNEYNKNEKPLFSYTQTDDRLDYDQPMHVANERTEINANINSPKTNIIQIDDASADVSEKQQSIFQNQSKYPITKKIPNSQVREAPTEVKGSFNNHELSENIVGDEFESLKVNPQIINDSSGQNIGLINNMDNEFSSKGMLPSKHTNENPKINSIAPTPAFGEERKIEIDVPNLISPMEQRMRNMDPTSELEPQMRMNDLKDLKFEENPEIIGDSFTGNNNDVINEDIDKLITPQEKEFLHNFGKIVPAAENLHLGSNSDVYFMGNGIKLPLRVSQDKDGSLALAVDIQKLCECKNATCSHKEQLLRQLDNNMGEIFNGPQMSLDVNGPYKSTNTESAILPIETKGASRHTHFSESNGYQNKIHRLHKRSSDESTQGILEHHYTENERKGRPESEIQNSLVKESNNQEERGYDQFTDLHKFKNAEKQLEERLEKLNADVQKSSKYYSNMLQKGTKDLLQIKGEDQIVKQRTELLNDLLKWMKEMAESIATFNTNNTTLYQ